MSKIEYTNKIKYFRLKKSQDENTTITQEMLGNAIGVTKTTIYLWESGRVVPSREHQKAITAFFRVKQGSIFKAIQLNEEELKVTTIKESPIIEITQNKGS